MVRITAIHTNQGASKRDPLHHRLRGRSINARAEFWMKVGMFADANLASAFAQTMAEHLKGDDVQTLGSEAA